VIGAVALLVNPPRLAVYWAEPQSESVWRLPAVNGGGLRVELVELRALLDDDEAARAMRGRAD